MTKTTTTETETAQDRKRRLDAAYNNGDRDARDRLLYANGCRKAWEAKGYGRETARNALGIPQKGPDGLWAMELHLEAGTPACQAALAAIAALPSVKKTAPVKSKAVTKSAKAADVL